MWYWVVCFQLKKKNLHGKEEFLPNVFNCLESFVAPEGAAQYRTEYVMSFKSAGAEDFTIYKIKNILDCGV